MLLIACPCAGLATPLAAWTVLGAAAKSGVIIRSGEASNGWPRIRAIRFDKTGTLTRPENGIVGFDVEFENGRDEVLWRAQGSPTPRRIGPPRQLPGSSGANLTTTEARRMVNRSRT